MSLSRPLAQLPKIDFAALVLHDPHEISRLVESCKTHGFFYLDLTNFHILEDKKDVLAGMDRYFAQPLYKKILDHHETNGEKDHTSGYKPAGLFAGVEHGRRDAYETLKVSREEVLSASRNLPEVINDQFRLFHRYVNAAEQIAVEILSALSQGLGLTGEKRLERFHAPDQSSRSTLVMLRYPNTKEVEEIGSGHNKHTDIGSITVLFSSQWGLQVLSPEQPDEWRWIEPREDCAIINVGDSLRFLSGNKLVSCVHRVVPTPEQETEDRLSLAYFLRANDSASFKDSTGRVVSARQWHDGKYQTFADTHEVQAGNAILTRGMEHGEILVR